MNYRTLVGAVAALAATVSIGCVSQIHRHIDTEARSVPGGREVKISVAQAEIKGDIQVSTAGGAFGLIGALMDAGANNSRAVAAEKRVTVVREALAGYDFDGIIQERTRATVARLEWLGAKEVTFGKEAATATWLKQLDAATTPQVLFLDFAYSLTPDFKAVRLSMNACLANRETPKGTASNDRISPAGLAYFQQFKAEYGLASAQPTPEENAKLWSADGGKLARAALEAALGQVQAMFERSATQTPEAAKALDRGETVKVGTYRGILIAKSEDGTLFREPLSGTWVFVSAKGL